MTVTKAKIAEHLVEHFHLDYPESYRFVSVFFETLGDALVENQQLKLAHLGSFHVIAKGKRPGRNPKTGELYEISARNAVSFTVSATLKKKMNQAN